MCRFYFVGNKSRATAVSCSWRHVFFSLHSILLSPQVLYWWCSQQILGQVANCCTCSQSLYVCNEDFTSFVIVGSFSMRANTIMNCPSCVVVVQRSVYVNTRPLTSWRPDLSGRPVDFKSTHPDWWLEIPENPNKHAIRASLNLIWNDSIFSYLPRSASEVQLLMYTLQRRPASGI